MALWTAAFAVAVAVATAPRVARGNGAFPESDSVLLPADRPNEILLATNFGIIETADGGGSWQWTCERPETSMSLLYGIGPPPERRLYAVSPEVGLAVSNDGSCSWRRAGGPLAEQLATDYFPDPSDPARVLAIAALDGDPGGGTSLLVSNDGGDSFDPSPMFTAPAGATLLGVEIARSDPRVVVLTMLLAGSRPALVRTNDAGAQWTTIDLEPALGPNAVRLIAIDARDPQLIALRVQAFGGDRLAITDDGGASFRTPVTVPEAGWLTAFVRLPSGTMLVTGLVPVAGTGATRGIAWRSSDGLSFEPWTLSPQPHLVALAERAGTLYLAAKNYSDGWALAVSTDEGRSLTPIMSYDQVTSIKACAMEVCRTSCDFQAGLTIWPPGVCSGELRDGGHDGNADGGPPGESGGCACAVGTAPDTPALAPIAMLVLSWWTSRRRRSLLRATE
jgi:MYXO-CTERM domain-containing protein